MFRPLPTYVLYSALCSIILVFLDFHFLNLVYAPPYIVVLEMWYTNDRMSKKICVYTCITGEYDDLHEIEKPEKNVDYYCFTNNKNLRSKTWKIIQIKDKGLDNQRLSRKIKMLGEPSVFKNYEISVWMDASVIWDKSIVDFVERYLGNDSFAAFIHHRRTTVKDEGASCWRLRKDTKESITRTFRHLEAEGFPDNLGLYEMTVFAKRHSDEVVKKTMEIWFKTVCNYSKRDQLSFPYAIWKSRLSVRPIKLSVWDNEWFHNEKHRLSRSVESCLVYFGNPDVEFDFDRATECNYKKRGTVFSFETTIPCDTDEIEFNYAQAAGSILNEVAISPKPSRFVFYGVHEHGDKKYVCTTHSVMRVVRNFRKGEKLLFSIDLNFLGGEELLSLLEDVWTDGNDLTGRTRYFEDDNKRLRQELKQIQGSRAWKVVSRLGRIVHRF